MRPGQPIAISRIMGSGLNYHSFYQKKSNLFAFVDTPQGFAAVKSLLEWPTFRALTGTGANRRNYITVYYTIATNRSIPYADRLSSWSVYGTNIVPLSGISILEYLSKKATVGNPKNNLVADNALACVSKNSTFEGLFCSLVLLGFRRTAIQKFTQEDVEAICRDVDDWAVDDGLPREEDISGERTRVSLEEEIWNSWVGMREEMRTEFEEKWKAKRRMDKENERGRAEKEQAWASWAARNKDQWNQVQWDEDVWRKYWGSWDSARDSWTKENTGQKQGKKEKKKTWNQHDSQEYWDWVGNGAGSKKNGTKAKENSEDWYRTQYTSTAGYGNANNRGSSYQKGGYKYTYEEPKDEKKKQNGYHGQSAKTGSGRKWWENKKSGYQGSSSKRRVWDGFASTPSSGDLDFYSILGIDSGANRSEIKKAYRKQAMQHHPDHNPDNLEGAHAKMKQIVVAWSVLKDDEKRMKYDKSGFIHF